MRLDTSPIVHHIQTEQQLTQNSCPRFVGYHVSSRFLVNHGGNRPALEIRSVEKNLIAICAGTACLNLGVRGIKIDAEEEFFKFLIAKNRILRTTASG